MDSNATTTTAADLARLSDKDKAELAHFIQNEQQRTRIQSRELPPFLFQPFRRNLTLRHAETHALTDICWKKCITTNIKSAKLDSGEEGCLANCVGRFLDVNMLTMKQLANLRTG